MAVHPRAAESYSPFHLQEHTTVGEEASAPVEDGSMSWQRGPNTDLPSESGLVAQGAALAARCKARKSLKLNEKPSE